MNVSPAGHRVELSVGLAAAATRGALVAGAAGTRVSGCSIDSRTLTPGDLFFAIRGERFDGHRFVGAALAAGAAGVVVSDRSAAYPSSPGTPVIVVEDTTRALQDVARHVRRASKTLVVGVTGSAGKTTTKEITADVLALRFDVFRSQGNFNNHIGLPLSLLNLRHGPQIAVVELGMNHPGELRVLTAIAEPDVRVWTNVAEVHAEFFESIEAIADAKAEILDGAAPHTIVVANANDPRVMARVRACPARVVTFGVETDADVTAQDVRDLGVAGTRATVQAAGACESFSVPLIGRGHLANALAATAVGIEFGVPLGDIASRIARVTPGPRRGEVRRLRDGVLLVDDSYNSNPRALERMLDALGPARDTGRRAAVLGEMLELGSHSVAMHRACGRAAAGAGLAWLITVGGEAARAMGEGAMEAGMAASQVAHAATSDEAADRVAGFMRAGDLVLVKGSRGIRTEIVADAIAQAWA